jgi:phosphate-selective porin OprO/OprP
MPVFSDAGYIMTLRVTGLPYYVDKGEKLVHVGMSYSYRKGNEDYTLPFGHALRYAARPEAATEYPFLDVTVTGVRNVNLFGAEAAMVYGPFSVQMEYFGSVLDTTRDAAEWGHSTVAHDDPCFGGMYVQASYFLTGEHRPYNTKEGAFDRVRPKKNFREDGGWGAVEVATRYSYLDMDDELLDTYWGTVGNQHYSSRGELHNWTLGVNWYLNPNVRIMANYIRSCPDRIDTANAADILMFRFQFDF